MLAKMRMNPSNLSILVVCALSGAGCMPEIKGITRSPAADPGPGAVGALNDGTWNVSLSRSPRISWAAPASFGSNGLGHYDYSIGSAAGLTDLLAWTSAGTASSTYATGLSLVDATDYFVNVRVVDAVGRFSAVTSSNGWRTRVTGAGAFAAAANQAANAAPRAVAVGDFNRDGKLDFVCANGGTGTTLSLYLGDGLGGFARQADLTVIQNPQGLVVADFDKDGFLDIAVISYFPGDL